MIYRDLAFDSDPWGGGGKKRTAQISEILARNGLEDCHLLTCPKLTFEDYLAAGDHLEQFHIGEKTITLPLGGGRKQALANHANECEQIILDETGGKGCLLWESTRSRNYFSILAAQQVGLSIIALPHNLELLVPGQRSILSGRFAPDCFDEELIFLALASSVFAISREEQWLLRLHGINADYLPYYPPGVIVKYLSDIRSRRQESTKHEGYLLLGTVGNPPTLQGMTNVIRRWSQIGQGKVLHVAGFHTERLNEIIARTTLEAAGVTVHGTVSNEELAELLVSVRAVILHQPPTTGALTRIPEMLLAGVPLLANRNAARNAHQTTGLLIYDSFVEFQSILTAADLPMPPQPVEPTKHEKRFIDTILKMTGKA